MRGRRILGRAVKRVRRAVLGRDLFSMEQRVRSLEGQVAGLEKRLATLDTPERRASELLSRENAGAIEHLLHEGVRLRRDVDAMRGGD